MELSNASVAKLLREVAAAYTVKKLGNIFQIRAYQNAADSIEHSTAEVEDLWAEGKLNQIPGLGEKIQGYLDELFKKGSVSHFEAVKQGLKPVFFELLEVPGVGPKTALKISEIGVESLDDLKRQIKNGQLVKKGFSGKLAQNIFQGIQEYSNRGNRMLLPYAFSQAQKILDYLKQSPDIVQADALGSLRRMVATIGDLDFAAASENSPKVIEHFTRMPGVKEVVDKGESEATVVLNNGLHIDLLVGKPDSYGALLQHFTGSKNHNIHLRTIAERKGLSLSEYGVRRVKNDELRIKNNGVINTKTEDDFYKLLGMETPAPEIREDTGEIEAALTHQLPDLITLGDIKGDLHLHSNFPLEPSHGPGADPIEVLVKRAQELGYEYVGISDHPPGFTTHTPDQIIKLIEKRTKFIQSLKSNKSIRVLNGLEIDILPDGSLSVPDAALETLDYCIAGIHSVHRGSKEEMTNRLLKALENPNVDIISHPTNRLINERDSSEMDWETIFKYCAKNHKILEINGTPNRLDLRDDLVKQAKEYGVKFVIDTDAHQVEGMDNMLFGVAVARRGWVIRTDVVNAWEWDKFAKWFNLE